MCLNLYYSSFFEVANQIADVQHREAENDIPDIERIDVLKSLLKILDATFGGNLLDKNWDAYHINRDIAILYCRLNKKDDAIAHLERAYDHAVLQGQYSDEDCFDVPLFKGTKVLPHIHWSISTLADLHNEFCDPKAAAAYDAIKEEPRYIALAEKLKL